uniref:Translation elongation factor EFTu/EF1A C-terminal domain-containing protein n=1 Tax=Cyprinodon variegatus TaxID=28743 RepID=A0A3Q2G4T4_CYPVA
MRSTRFPTLGRLWEELCTGETPRGLTPPHMLLLRTGERAVVCFRFIKHPEYLRLGAKLLFREGVTKGIGHVTSLLPHDQNLSRDQNLQDY